MIPIFQGFLFWIYPGDVLCGLQQWNQHHSRYLTPRIFALLLLSPSILSKECPEFWRKIFIVHLPTHCREVINAHELSKQSNTINNQENIAKFRPCQDTFREWIKKCHSNLKRKGKHIQTKA